MLPFELALRYVISRKRPMAMSLMGIVFGISFFVLTQAQTAGFEAFFIRTILGTNGAILISDRFQNTSQVVHEVDNDGKTRFLFDPSKESTYREGVDHPQSIIDALQDSPNVEGISEILKGKGTLSSIRTKQTVEIHGIRISEHRRVSDLGNFIQQGSLELFRGNTMGALVGSRIFYKLGLQIGDRVSLIGVNDSIQLRVSGVFESGVNEIDKNRIYLHIDTARSFLGRPFGGSVFQLSLKDPNQAPEVAAHMQSFLNHRVVSWQEREQVWLDVFKALRFSSAITVSTILLLSGLGIFNVCAIMVVEKKRDIAILRSFGFSQRDVSLVFIWQGVIVLTLGIFLGFILGFLATYGVSQLPLRIRGIFSTDHFVVHWDISHYIWAAIISSIFVAVATWIPSRRAAKIEPAKIIREAN